MFLVMFMDNSYIKSLLKMICWIALILIIGRFLIFLLPVILVGVLIYMVYNRVVFYRMKKNNENYNNMKEYTSNSRVIDKNIIEAEVVHEENY